MLKNIIVKYFNFILFFSQDFFCFCSKAENDKPATQNVNIETNNNAYVSPKSNHDIRETENKNSKPIPISTKNTLRSNHRNKVTEDNINKPEMNSKRSKTSNSNSNKNSKAINITITNINTNIQNVNANQLEVKENKKELPYKINDNFTFQEDCKGSQSKSFHSNLSNSGNQNKSQSKGNSISKEKPKENPKEIPKESPKNKYNNKNIFELANEKQYSESDDSDD